MRRNLYKYARDEAFLSKFSGHQLGQPVSATGNIAIDEVWDWTASDAFEIRYSRSHLEIGGNK